MMFYPVSGSLWKARPAWLQQLAARLPLSQIIEAARAVMLEGAGWQEVAGPLGQVMVFAPGVHLAGSHAVQMECKMKPVLWLLLVAALPVQAGTLRCKNALLTEGDTTAELLVRCGQPMLKEDLTRFGRTASGRE